MSDKTYLIYDNRTNTYSYTDFEGYNAWLNGIDIRVISVVPGTARFTQTPISTSSVVGGNDNYSIATPNSDISAAAGYQQQIQPGDGQGQAIYQVANINQPLDVVGGIDVDAAVKLQDGTEIIPNSFVDGIIFDASVTTPLVIPGSVAADPAFDPIVAAREADLRQNRFATQAEAVAGINLAFEQLINQTLNARPEVVSGLVDAEIAFQSGVSREQPVGEGITPRGGDFDLQVVGTGDYYSQIVEFAEAASINLPAAVQFFQTGAPNPLDFGFNVNTGAFASNEDAELYAQARVSRIERVINTGSNTIVAGLQLQQAILVQNLDTFTTRNADGSITVDPIVRSQLLNSVGEDPSVQAAIRQQIQQAGGNIGAADLRVNTLVPLANQIATEEFNRVMNSQPQSVEQPTPAANLSGQGRTIDRLPDPTGGFTTVPSASLPTVLLGDDIQITQIQQELAVIEAQLAARPIPQISELPPAQEFNNVTNTPAGIISTVSTTLSDYFGVSNPSGQSAIERAVQLAFNQIPGVSEINRTVGAVRTVSNAVTTLSSDQLTAQEAIRATLSVVALANPAVGILLRGLELTGAFGGPALTERITTLSETASQALEQPLRIFGGGGGVAATENDTTVDAEVAQAGSGQSDFVESSPGGLLVAPEDLFVQQGENGLFVLRDEVEDRVESTLPEPVDADETGYYPNGLPYDDNGNLNPGWAINPETGQPYFKGNDYIDPVTAESSSESLAAARQAATLASARSQAAQQAQRKQANDGDWRVKLRLAPGAEYLYRDPGLNSSGILWPLNVTDGVIFPYMPVINTTYHAAYNSYDLTHSNYRGYFYQNSYVGEVSLSAVFTAQDTKEAEYMLAVIHFFRSVTKMFYGQDTPGRGSPPPLVYLQGLGEYQFNLHPCLVSQFTYNLPNDVDYIRARSPNIVGTNLQIKRDRKTNPTNPFSAAIERLNSIGQPKGGINIPPPPPTLGTNSPTYVPTKIDIQLTLLPTQTRQQVSQEFSLQNFANGNLLKGGYW